MKIVKICAIGITNISLLVSFSFAGGTNSIPAETSIQRVTVLQPEWRPLLDERRTNWECWLGVPLKSVTGLPPGTPTSTNFNKGIPLGLNNDPKHVFSITNLDGEPALHITGEIFGGLTTRESFANYHLQLETRWGKTKWPPKLDAPRDSGVLFHCQGAHGASWNAWKRSVEFQVEEANDGDAYFLAGTSAEVHQSEVAQPGTVPFYDPAGKLERRKTRVRHLAGDFENLGGEWNVLDLYVLGDKAVYVVNGHVVNVIENIRVDGMPVTSGQILIQCEGAEVEYRRIQIRPITEFPAGLLSVP